MLSPSRADFPRLVYLILFPRRPGFLRSHPVRYHMANYRVLLESRRLHARKEFYPIPSKTIVTVQPIEGRRMDKAKDFPQMFRQTPQTVESANKEIGIPGTFIWRSCANAAEASSAMVWATHATTCSWNGLPLTATLLTVRRRTVSIIPTSS